jgi:DNA repair photolyase
MKIQETTAKSILVASKLPDADYVLNPYTGCRFGCAYCYASFMGRYVDEPIESWGDYVYVKTNAVELLKTELASMRPARMTSSILLSSVTDPYQAVESRYRLVRGLLEALADARYPGSVSILTKAPLVTRDIDVLSRLPQPEVGMTITTTDDAVSRWLEVRAPSASKRLRALRTLTDAGINTYAFVGPLLPHFRFRPELLDQLFGSLAAAGVREVYVEHMNLRGYIRQRLDDFLVDQPEEIRAVYAGANTKEHRAALDELVAPLLREHGLRLRLDEVIHHDTVGQLKKGTRA